VVGFRLTRQARAMAITSYKPTYHYRSGSNADIDFWIAYDSSGVVHVSVATCCGDLRHRKTLALDIKERL
jgi:hypothetical protein